MDELQKVCLDLARIWNVNSSEITKMVHEYIGRSISCDYDRLNCPKPPIYIGPVKVKTLKERLEEATMHEDCYFCVKRDICTRNVPKPCIFKYTEEERIADQTSNRIGVILNATYLPSTYHKKEETKMKKATSVQNIKNVNGVSFSIENHPMETTSKLIIVASTNDDIFAFEFEGQDILQSCKAAGLFTGWEKDQKIRELEKDVDEIRREKNKEINKLKQQLQQAEIDKRRLTWKNEQLEEENKNLRIQVRVLEDIKRENAELKDKLLKVLWTVADCEINKGGYKDE